MTARYSPVDYDADAGGPEERTGAADGDFQNTRSHAESIKDYFFVEADRSDFSDLLDASFVISKNGGDNIGKSKTLQSSWELSSKTSLDLEPSLPIEMQLAMRFDAEGDPDEAVRLVMHTVKRFSRSRQVVLLEPALQNMPFDECSPKFAVSILRIFFVHRENFSSWQFALKSVKAALTNRGLNTQDYLIGLDR